MMQISRPYLFLLMGYMFLLLVIAASANLGIGLWVISASTLIPFGDKLGHLVLAGILSFLFNSALRCRTISFSGVEARVGSLLAYLLVLTEELSQFWLAARNVDPYDLLCAVLGIYVFGALATRNQRIETERQS